MLKSKKSELGFRVASKGIRLARRRRFALVSTKYGALGFQMVTDAIASAPRY